jgi:hypothetical protein
MDADAQQLLQAGGLGVLAVMVYLELRAIRPVLQGLQLALTALLERERYRDGDTPRNFPALRRAPTEPPQ